MNHATPESATRNILVAAGDIMLGDSATSVGFGFRSRHQLNADAAFSRIAPVLQRGEIVVGNLECALSDFSAAIGTYRANQMRGIPAYATSLRAAGFTALNLANNHAMQHGRTAFNDTVDLLRQAGIASVGIRGTGEWCASPVVQTTHAGFRVGLLGYCWRPRQYGEGPPLYAEGNEQTVIEDVGRLAAITDAVVVSLHWGEEFVSTPSAAEVAIAHRIIDAGASIIVGHHPHVVRPVERYGRGVICYSLGNLVTDMVWLPELRGGALLECALSGDSVADTSTWSTRVDNSYSPDVEGTSLPVGPRSVTGIDEATYQIAVARSVRRQRIALYSYVARNAGRYSLPVLSALIASTFRNKLATLGSALTGRRK